MSRLIIWNISLCLYSNKIFHGVSREKNPPCCVEQAKNSWRVLNLRQTIFFSWNQVNSFLQEHFLKLTFMWKEMETYSISLMSSGQDGQQNIYRFFRKNKNGWNLNETYKLGNLWSSLRVPSEITGTSEDWSKCIPTQMVSFERKRWKQHQHP